MAGIKLTGPLYQWKTSCKLLSCKILFVSIPSSTDHLHSDTICFIFRAVAILSKAPAISVRLSILRDTSWYFLPLRGPGYNKHYRDEFISLPESPGNSGVDGSGPLLYEASRKNLSIPSQDDQELPNETYPYAVFSQNSIERILSEVSSYLSASASGQTAPSN